MATPGELPLARDGLPLRFLLIGDSYVSKTYVLLQFAKR
jgi:hypothetical protein